MGILWDYYAGVDLGLRQDFTAFSIMEEPTFANAEAAQRLFLKPGWHTPDKLSPYQVRMLRELPYGMPARPVLTVRHLKRYPLGTRYTTIVEDVAKILRLSPLKDRCVLVLDVTGVGEGVLDLFKQAGMDPVAITITAGNDVHGEEGGLRLGVPKRELVGRAEVLFEQERLKIVPSLPEAGTLTAELQAYKRTVSLKGKDTYGNDWRENPHDDLVLSVALAGWYREWLCWHMDNAYCQAPSVQGNPPAESRVERALREAER
jgi:hypothetical protein